jgi:hypothetical protein
VTLALFVQLFRKVFGFDDKSLPLLVSWRARRFSSR